MKKTLVLGASLYKGRYSNHAIRMLSMKGIDVSGIGIRSGQVENCSIVTEKANFENIHTVSLYLNPLNQQSYYKYVISLKPQRVIFNPGSENPEFELELSKHQIFFERACTLVLLRTNQF